MSDIAKDIARIKIKSAPIYDDLQNTLDKYLPRNSNDKDGPAAVTFALASCVITHAGAYDGDEIESFKDFHDLVLSIWDQIKGGLKN